MDIVAQVETAFLPGGSLSRAESRFVSREGQTRMAVAVAKAIKESRILVVEASTGVGKTFSYLVPALLSGESVMVSTATKALQDQLFSKDLPRLVEALGISVRTALLKGRASYLCLHRMDAARHDAALHGHVAHGVSRIVQWSQATKTGDLAEMDGLDERSPLIPLVTSTRENCLGSVCPEAKTCYVNLARREAMSADVVIINHHLFFADLAVRESGVAELLPTVGIAVFDEAHQLNETGVQFLGTILSTGQMLDFCRDLLAAGLQLARGLVDWPSLAAGFEQAARDLRLCAGRQPAGGRLRWTQATPEGLDEHEWSVALAHTRTALSIVRVALDTVSEIAPDFVKLADRASGLDVNICRFQRTCVPGYVRWIDAGIQLKMTESPLTIAEAMKTKVLQGAEGSRKAWIFTSATLGDDESCSWFTQSCGLTTADVLRVGSPFNYPEQAALYVPRAFPKPSDPLHISQVAEATARWASLLGGRTLVLTTTLRALHGIGQTLAAKFDKAGDIEVLIQGTRPKRVLIERFRQGTTQNGIGCVLVASASFWEGIDFPGNALQLVVIDKLPFPPPNDPLVEARAKALEAEGKNPFNDYYLPDAAVALKQGAGRLIRRETDEGVLVICDSRLISMSYGRRLVRSMPPMERLETEEHLLERLNTLTRTCTKDCL